MDGAALASEIKRWGCELGFQAVGIADVDLTMAARHLDTWLGRGWHGDMDYMARRADLRRAPERLHPGTTRVISCRMDYLASREDGWATLADGRRAYVARYALGRDYHRVLRSRLNALCERIRSVVGRFEHRVFSDSAPVMEVEFASRAGLGWRGKHTLLLSREAGSWYVLGEIYCGLELEIDAPAPAHCGSCTRCIEVCPTRAIRAPYQLDARRCISYLTIELKGAIPEVYRPLMGNRVYGCDDCQLVCPWNRYAQRSAEPDFAVRHGLDTLGLLDAFAWTRSQFDARTAGSAIRRIGYERWLRNVAVALGNAPTSPSVVAALAARRDDASALVREHVAWALSRHALSARGVAAAVPIAGSGP